MIGIHLPRLFQFVKMSAFFTFLCAMVPFAQSVGGLIQIPLRWCAVQGSPAVTNPGGVGEPDTDNVLWRRHERASDNIWIPGANITFRSGFTAAVLNQATFPIINDPTPPANGGPGQLGDILDPQINGNELNLAIAACNTAWNAIAQQFNTPLLGPIALNLRQFVDNSGNPTNLVGWGGFTGLNSGANFCGNPPGNITSAANGFASVVDNSFRLPADGIDALLAHELGHVFMLGHGNGLDDDNDGPYDDNVFNCDPSENVNAGPANMMAPTVGSGVMTARQRATSRPVAQVYSGAQIDPPAALIPGDSVGDQRVDKIQDVEDPSLDIVSVSVTMNTPTATTSFSHRLLGIIDPAPGEVRQYLVFADLDNDPSTGGDAATLGFDTGFRGAELVTRVLVSPIVIEERPVPDVLLVQNAGPTLSTDATVWHFEAGSFVEVNDPSIVASAFAPIGGERPTALFSVAMIEMANDVRGPVGSRARLQAVAQLIEPDGELDRLPDEPEDGGVEVILEPPVFPVCGVTPEMVPIGGLATVEAEGLIPGGIAKVLLGEDLMTMASIDANGRVTAQFTIPNTSRSGLRLVTVGVEGTALTADCAVNVPPRQVETKRYQYAAKLVCGVQPDSHELRLARGIYATTINVLNPGDEPIKFNKHLALTIPPGEQQPGDVLSIAEDLLKPQQALAVDCEDIRKRVFDGRFPMPYIEGFVVLESSASLDVVAVYTTATLTVEGTAESHSSIEVVPIPERIRQGSYQERMPDLVVRDIDLSSLQVDCPQGGRSCVTSVDVTVANIGSGNAGALATRVILDPSQSVGVDELLPAGLGSGISQGFSITTPAGGNCFDPDCTICAKVDAFDEVIESDENNNETCVTRGG